MPWTPSPAGFRTIWSSLCAASACRRPSSAPESRRGSSTRPSPPRRRAARTGAITLAAHYRGSLQTVPIPEIIYLLADQKYVTVRHEGGDLLVDEALKALEDEFPDIFMRIHRNALVARSRLSGLEKGPDGTTLVRLRGCDERLPVSRRHLSDIRRWLRGGALD